MKKSNRIRLTVEGLENRSLMAAGITSNLANGVLTIGGTEAADRIVVAQLKGWIGVSGGKTVFDAAAVKAIRVNAMGGNDTVLLNRDVIGGQRIEKLCVIDAGAGNDTVFGSAGMDVIYGGSGDDVLVGHAGNDLILGNDGNDFLFGQGGHDVLDGGAGSDWLIGGGGTNCLLDDAGGAVRRDGIRVDRHVDQLTQRQGAILLALLLTPPQSAGIQPVTGTEQVYNPVAWGYLTGVGWGQSTGILDYSPDFGVQYA